MEKLKIGQLALKAGVKITTIRYYELKELIPHPERTNSGYRQYNLDMVKRVKFIKSAQKLGFSLREIKELLAIKLNDVDQCDRARERAEKKIKEIEKRIKDLKKISNALRLLTEECRKRKPNQAECPLLEALESIV